VGLEAHRVFRAVAAFFVATGTGQVAAAGSWQV
jgi:hypothetical protein